MIVSSIAKFNALNGMNNAAYNVMQNNNAMLGNLNSFSGTTNLQSAHRNEMKLTFSNLKNRLAYMVNEAQLKKTEKYEKENIKRTFNAFA